MTDPTPATPTSPVPDTTPDQPESVAKPTPAATKAARRARAEAMIAGPKTPPPAPAKAEASESAEPAAAEPAAPQSKSKLDAIKEKLAKQAENRAAKQAEQAKDERIAKLEERITKASDSPMDVEAIAKRIFDEFDRDPAATTRKYGRDPRKLVERLTKDLIAPGTLAAMQAAESSKSELQKTNERLDKWEREQAEQAQQRAYAEERQAIVQHATTDKKRWEKLSALPDARRLWWTMNAYHALTEAGHEYDRELTLDAAEALLDEDYKHISPPAPTPKPEPSPQEQSQVATKKPAKTLTPDLAAPSGSKRPKTRSERKEQLVAQLERERAAR